MQGGLGDLSDGVLVVLYVDDDLDRVEDAVVDDGVDADGDVVAGDAFLGGHRHRDDLHVDLVQAIGDGVSPGPRVAARSWPKRNTTPRSYWVMIRVLDPASSRTIAAIAISANTMVISSSVSARSD